MNRNCFDEEHDQFREAFRYFVENEVVPYREKWWEQGCVDREVWEKAGENGYLIPRAPEEYGGLGFTDFRYEQIMVEELSLVGESGFTIQLHNTIVAPYILNFGSKALLDGYLERLVSGKCILGIAMTEPNTGSDLAAIRTRAVDKGDHFVLNGNKTFISNGQTGDLFVVAARTSDSDKDNISLFAVDANWSGFRRGKPLRKMGMKSQDTSELFFEDVEIPREFILGEFGHGFRYMMQGLAEERTIVAVWSLALAECAFALTLDYVKTRKAFGVPIASFQNTQFTMAEMRARMDMAQAFVDALVQNINNGTVDPVAASSAKLLCSEIQGDVVDQCLQLFGGNGYMDEYLISRLYSDSRISRIFGGTSEIMKMVIGRSLGLG